MSRKAPIKDFRFEVREAELADVHNGLLQTLESLSEVGGLTPASAREILSDMGRAGSHLFTAVVERGKVIGATTLLVEKKLIHKGGLVGHIEDVAVRGGYEGKGVGRALVGAAVERARDLGCYKVILDCSEDVVGFYEKLGFRRHEVGMRIDLKRKS